jgi:hypothetical protein
VPSRLPLPARGRLRKKLQITSSGSFGPSLVLMRTTHREFAMASGEMSEAEFTDFLYQTFQRIAEQIELTCIAVRMAMSSRRARHGHLPDSRRESPMLGLNPAIAMVRPKRTSHPAVALPRR